MNEHKSKLYLILGAWVSFVAVVMAGTILLPPSEALSQNSQALLYKLAANEELAHAEEVVPGKSILADLDQMTISLYEDDVLLRSFSILSRGKERTFWETPTGSYEIGTKELKHFSSIGGTWMPYSMQFYGNFFIHGWPTYPNGKPVAKGYSGGCIRLSTEDAKAVYEFAEIGTKVSVSSGASVRQFATTSHYYLRAPELLGERGVSPTLPEVKAQSFIVADADSGEILWQRAASSLVRANELVSLPVALTALETVDQYKYVRMGDLLLDRSVLRKKATGKPDELSVGSLIYPLLFDTNDTAAKAFARERGVQSFVRDMNQKMMAIGMEDTEFGGVLGGDSSSTTARDLLALLTYVNAHKHFLVDVTLSSGRTFIGTDGSTEFHWENKNPWLQGGDEGYRGGVGIVRQNGSGNALLLFALPVSEFSERTVAFVVPESPDIKGDIARLREFVLAHFIYGIEREQETFIREKEEPTPSLLQKMKRVLDLNNLLQERTEYQREV